MLTVPENVIICRTVFFPSGVYAAGKVSSVCSEGACSSSGLGRGAFYIPVSYLLTIIALQVTLGFAWSKIRRQPVKPFQKSEHTVIF